MGWPPDRAEWVERVAPLYERALSRILADLAVIDITPEVVIDFTDPEDLPYQYRGKRGTRGVLFLGNSEEEAAVEVADLVQDDVLHDLWGPAWPECPGHDHPAKPQSVSGTAYWTCPKDGHPLCPIGQLADLTKR